MDNIVYNLSSSSEEDEDKDYIYNYFMNDVKQDSYNENRNKLFTKDIEKIRLLINGSFSSNNEFTFYLSGSMSNQVGGLGKIDNVIGIQLVQSMIYGYTNTNTSNTYCDIIVDEVPKRACILNENGKHIIARIPITQMEGHLLNVFEPENVKKCNSFFPLSIDRLTIKLEPFIPSTFDSEYKSSFEFELTILNNLELIR